MAFVVFIIFTGIISLLGFIVSPYILFPIFQIVPAVMFCVRKIGIIVPFAKIRTTELVGDVLLLVLALILHKLTWGGTILLLLLRALFLLIVWYEDKHYVYIEEDI